MKPPTSDVDLLGLLSAVLEDGRHLLLPALGPLSARNRMGLAILYFPEALLKELLERHFAINCCSLTTTEPEYVVQQSTSVVDITLILPLISLRKGAP